MIWKFKEDHPRIRAYAPERWVLLRYYNIAMLLEEVEQFGRMLQQKYPDGVFLSPEAYGYSGKQYPSSVSTYPDLFTAGATRRTSYAYFRVPWPEDEGLPEPIRLLGLYDTPDTPDPALFRRLGRRIKVSWPGETRKFGPTLLGRWKEKDGVPKVDHDYDLMNSYLKITALFDSRDPDILQFLGEIEQMLLDMTTCEFAVYDASSGALINPSKRNKSQRYTDGVIRYAALHDQIYLGTCHKRGHPLELKGVKPEVRAAIRAEAGLGPD
jgi:hypothetical protein